MSVTRSKPNCLIGALVGIWSPLLVNAQAALENTLFDFSAATNVPAWQIVNDDVMGGASTSSFSPTRDTVDGSFAE